MFYFNFYAFIYVFQLNHWPATSAIMVWRDIALAIPKWTAPPTPVSAIPEKQVCDLLIV